MLYTCNTLVCRGSYYIAFFNVIWFYCFLASLLSNHIHASFVVIIIITPFFFPLLHFLFRLSRKDQLRHKLVGHFYSETTFKNKILQTETVCTKGLLDNKMTSPKVYLTVKRRIPRFSLLSKYLSRALPSHKTTYRKVCLTIKGLTLRFASQ